MTPQHPQPPSLDSLPYDAPVYAGYGEGEGALAPTFNHHGLEVPALRYSYVGETLLTFPYLRLPQGHVGVLTGPNGSGKTTFLRLIAGILPSALSASILWDDASLASQASYCIAYKGPQLGVEPTLTAGAILRFHRSLAARPWNAQVPDFPDIPLQQLSKGQQQHVALLAALMDHRPLWLLDEPLSHLDTATAHTIVERILHHARQGGVAVVACHDQHVAQACTAAGIPIVAVDLKGSS